ncbi:MAG: hypothetical protein RJA70_19 [Pseudomonadota bacterium]|jgi:ribonuclease-3
MTTEVARLFGLSAESTRFREALTHPSFANERRIDVHNQRLEFLGDAVLELCSSEELFERFPEADEGELTRRRAQLVNADALAAFARDSGIAAALRLGRGAEANGLRDSTNVLADAVEALLAATYLDSGLVAARAACRHVIRAALERAEGGEERDPKTQLQESVQALGFAAPCYSLVDSGGPAHERWFEVQVSVGAVVLSSATGRSKRAAERDAADLALKRGLTGLASSEESEANDGMP